MAALNTAFNGTDLKYLLEIQATGFDMETDDFEVTLKKGQKTLVIKKEDMPVESYYDTDPATNISTEKHNYYVCFDSSYFGSGPITAVVTAYVPDVDFDGGIRKLVDKFELVNVLAV